MCILLAGWYLHDPALARVHMFAGWDLYHATLALLHSYETPQRQTKDLFEDDLDIGMICPMCADMGKPSCIFDN